jgi:hypothetical protein
MAPLSIRPTCCRLGPLGLLAVVLAVLALTPAVAAAAVERFATVLLGGAEGGPPPHLAGYTLTAAGWAGEDYALTFSPDRTDFPAIAIHLAPSTDGGPAYARTPSFRVSYRLAGPAGRATPVDVAALTDAVVATIKAHDPGDLRLPGGPVRSLATGAASVATAADQPLQHLTWALLALALLAIPLLVVVSVGHWPRWLPRRPARPLWQQPLLWLVVVVGVGVAGRLLAPQTLVMVHMGHELVEQAQRLGPPPKYGPAAPQWLHLLFALTGPRWPAMVLLSQVAASLTLVLTPALLWLLGARGWSVVAATALVAVSPVLVHDAATESILVPTMLAVVASGVAGASAIAGRSRLQVSLLWLAAWGLCGLAMLARPEFLALAPGTLLAVVVLAAARHQAFLAVRWPLAAGLVLVVVVAALRVVQLDAVMAVEKQLGNTPRVFASSRLQLVLELARDAWWRKNGLLWPQLVPVVGWLWMALALRRRPGQQPLLLVTLALSFGYLLPTALDLPWISVPRVQAPAFYWFAVASGLALPLAVAAVGPERRRLALAGALVLTAGSLAATLPAALWRHLSQQEEDAFANAVQALAPGSILATRTHLDPPDERIHLLSAAGLLAPSSQLVSLQALLSGEVKPGPGRPVYAWLGSRCALRPCDAAGLHPACQAVRSQFVLRPVQVTAVHVPAPNLPSAFSPPPTQPPGASPRPRLPLVCAKAGLDLGAGGSPGPQALTRSATASVASAVPDR